MFNVISAYQDGEFEHQESLSWPQGTPKKLLTFENGQGENENCMFCGHVAVEEAKWWLQIVWSYLFWWRKELSSLMIKINTLGKSRTLESHSHFTLGHWPNTSTPSCSSDILTLAMALWTPKTSNLERSDLDLVQYMKHWMDPFNIVTNLTFYAWIYFYRAPRIIWHWIIWQSLYITVFLFPKRILL